MSVEFQRLGESADQSSADSDLELGPQAVSRWGSSSPETRAGLLSSALFSWVTPVVRYGFKTPLETFDLFPLCEGDLTEHQWPRFERAWHAEQAGDRPKNKLLYAMHRSLGFSFYLAAVPKFIQDSIQFAGPLLLVAMINFVADPSRPLYVGLLLVLGFLLFKLVQTIAVNAYFHRALRSGMNLRSVLINAIYRKSLRLSAASRSSRSAGEILNYMTSDVTKLSTLAQFAHLIWSCPFQIVVCVSLLVRAIGPSALAGVGVMVLIVPLQGKLGRVLTLLRQSIARFTDTRVKTTNELLLTGIRVIKSFGWDENVSSRITDARKSELSVLKKISITNAVNLFVMFSTMLFVSLATFVTYAATSKQMSASAVFSAISLFGLLWFPVSFLPVIVNRLTEARTSISRLESFLLLDELDGGNGIPVSAELARGAVLLRNASFSWSAGIAGVAGVGTGAGAGAGARVAAGAGAAAAAGAGAGASAKAVDAAPALVCPELYVQPGQLVMVVGSIGSGKSTLLSAILGQITRTSGSVALGGSVAYVPQEPWIMNASLRDNVLFGRVGELQAERHAYRERRGPVEAAYYRALAAAALEHDLSILPDGDRTEIGEKGLTLSGGQKARVSLARAVLVDADVYLLDDPLAAVDVHVGQHLMDRCICDPLALGGKTRVLVTHHVKYLPRADLVVVVEGGRVAHVGSHAALLAQGVDFIALAAAQRNVEGSGTSETEGELHEAAGAAGAASAAAAAAAPSLAGMSVADTPAPDTERTAGLSRMQAEAAAERKGQKAPAALMTEEERATGAVTAQTYKFYIRACGGYAGLTLVIGFFALGEGLRIGTDLWLAKWASDSSASLRRYLPIYIGLSLSTGLVSLVRTIVWAFASLRASSALHGALLQRVIAAPMAWFDTTPVGRILSRFSKDIDTIDNGLPAAITSLAWTFSRTFATLVLVIYIMPWFSVPVVPTLVLYWYIQLYYRSTARELQRLDAVSRSPIFALFGETIAGVNTIRAFSLADVFAARSARQVDENHRAYWLSVSANRWLSVRLELVGNMLAVFTALIAVTQRGSISPATVGLAIAYQLLVVDSLNWAVRMLADLEVSANSVERVKYYITSVPQEAAQHVQHVRLPADWPARGEVVFDHASMSYREGLPPALRDVSFAVAPGSKLGVVGRSGAGKSSLVVCLLRLAELSGGRILIDGVDIATLGLADLRRRLAMIPQSPTLFSGTIRANLDPFAEHSDAQIWQALERAHIAERIRALPAPPASVDSPAGGMQLSALDFVVAEGGENFSMGERQLVALARALLRSARVVLLDEATSSVDMATDALIQRTVRTEFAACTVITIAHRLVTVLDADRVLVMAEGGVAEYDAPGALVDRPGSVLAAMVADADAGEVAHLRAVAHRQAPVS